MIERELATVWEREEAECDRERFVEWAGERGECDRKRVFECRTVDARQLFLSSGSPSSPYLTSSHLQAVYAQLHIAQQSHRNQQ